MFRLGRVQIWSCSDLVTLRFGHVLHDFAHFLVFTICQIFRHNFEAQFSGTIAGTILHVLFSPGHFLSSLFFDPSC
jgi:hypothetical protein